MSSSGPNNSGDVPTLLVKDSEGRDLLCFLEQLIPLDGQDYALLTPVDTPVCLFRLNDGDEPDPEDLDEDEAGDDESETYELLVSFLVDELEYGLYIPLDPFFVVARMDDGAAVLVEGDEFDQIQPRIEAELDERELSE